MRGSHRFAVPQDAYEKRNAYEDPPTDAIACRRCGRVMTVELARNTLPDHLIPNTLLGCDGSGAHIRRVNGRVVVALLGKE